VESFQKISFSGERKRKEQTSVPQRGVAERNSREDGLGDEAHRGGDQKDHDSAGVDDTKGGRECVKERGGK